MDGGYTVKFPWRQDHAPLPTHYAISERWTRSLANARIMEMYGKIIAEQEKWEKALATSYHKEARSIMKQANWELGPPKVSKFKPCYQARSVTTVIKAMWPN